MLKESYLLAIRKKYFLIAGTLLLTILCGYWFTTIGMQDVSIWQTIIALQSFFAGTINESPSVTVNKIILLLRIPRILLAILSGVGLSIAGAIMQSVTRNYLVSPFTLGISSAAAFGASMCIVFGTGLFFASDLGVIICAFISACTCGLILYGLSSQIGINSTAIVLVGIALNYIFSAMTAVLEFISKEHNLEAIVQWSFGSFNHATWESVSLTALVILICSIVTMRHCLPLNAMASNDDETVKSLGVNPERLRTIGGLLAILMTSTIISFTGIIAFAGLITPHIARFIIGNDHRYYLPFASILGALLLLLSDNIGKFILYPVNIPVGIVLSFLGVPLFIHLILFKRRGIG